MSKSRVRNTDMTVKHRARLVTALERYLLAKPKKGAPATGSDRYQPSIKKKTPKGEASGQAVVAED